MGEGNEGSSDTDLFDEFGGEGIELLVGEATEARERVGIVTGWRSGRSAYLLE